MVGSAGSVMPPDQLPRDRLPLRRQIARRRRLARARIPVAGVALVAFLPVQVGMHPRPVGSANGLRERMRLVPLAERVMPQRQQGAAQPGRRRGPGRGFLEIRK